MPTEDEIRDGRLQALQSRDDEIDRLRTALQLIAGFKGLTLLAPSLCFDSDKGHQIGAAAAFNQAADIARDALGDN